MKCDLALNYDFHVMILEACTASGTKPDEGGVGSLLTRVLILYPIVVVVTVARTPQDFRSMPILPLR